METYLKIALGIVIAVIAAFAFMQGNEESDIEYEAAVCRIAK